MDDIGASVLDPRLGDRFSGERKYPAHEYARYVLQDILGMPGPLVDEDWLSARLGLDRESSEDWVALKDKLLDDSRYKGVFGDAWVRWWWFKVENWWSTLHGKPINMRQLSAVERVRLIREATGFANLQPATPIEMGYSDKFWTICLALDKPLDPIDGVLAERASSLPWHEAQYLSLTSVLSRVASGKGLRVHPLERERLKEMRSQS